MYKINQSEMRKPACDPALCFEFKKMLNEPKLFPILWYQNPRQLFVLSIGVYFRSDVRDGPKTVVQVLDERGGIRGTPDCKKDQDKDFE